jgi:hypothetical protein
MVINYTSVIATTQYIQQAAVVASYNVSDVYYGGRLGMVLKESNVMGNPVTLHRI